MNEVIPQYEVLYGDLLNHNIGYFLSSREFKLFMSEKGYFNQWKNLFEQVKSNRTYFAFGVDHEPGDASKTLALYLNAIPQQKVIEDLVSEIIAQFIDWVKKKTDFLDVIESMKIANFKEKNLQAVHTQIEIHVKKEFPKKEIEEVIQKTIKNVPNKKDIFIVHGHNEEIKHNVARVLERLKLNPIILHEQSNEGLTVIEKFEKHSNVAFAVILLTYDDFGNAKSLELKNKRARQNVILELGYFIAKLGRKSVLPLYEEGVELPSDISGVLYTKIDESENWKFRLVKELKAAGFNANANDIL